MLEVGAGYCQWINNVVAARRVAVDIWPDVARFAAPGVEAVVLDVARDLARFGPSTFDTILASNILEHFEPGVAASVVDDFGRLLKPEGRLIVIQPNFRYASRQYFDDYTHRAVFTDVSLPNLLRAHGFQIDRCSRGSCRTRCAARSCQSGHGRFARICNRHSSRWPGRCSSSRRKGLTHVGTRTVSIVLPAYNEEQYIRPAVEDFFVDGVVDEVIVVDNNSRDRTAEEAAATRARVVRETAQGYGHALRRGLREATGDLVIMAEPDGTFVGRDVLKLLAYADDFEMVCGTRTTRELIWRQANMGWFLRWGNWIVAKMIQVLYGGPSLTDCGCTLRLTHRTVLARIQDELYRRRFALPSGDGHRRAEARCTRHRGAGKLPRTHR